MAWWSLNSKSEAVERRKEIATKVPGKRIPSAKHPFSGGIVAANERSGTACDQHATGDRITIGGAQNADRGAVPALDFEVDGVVRLDG